jgi:predicted ATP-grasp superfamily ATP-dependent carboligase
MAEAVKLWEQPAAGTINMIIGWRQWADAGSVSSGLPEYLVQRMGARQIGEISPDGFYLFQIPGMHDLVRPVVEFDDGYPESLEIRRNEIFYAGDSQTGTVIFLGDEPNLDIERYTAAILDVAERLKVKRIVSFGGVYGELPYDKERTIGGIYSLSHIRPELDRLALNPSDYHGGASIGSYVCRRAGDRGLEFVGLYAFVPLYDLSQFSQRTSTIRIENDYTAWLGVMRRVNYLFKLRFDLSDLEDKSEQLLNAVEAKVSELERLSPQAGVREYMQRLSEGFTELTFDPLDDVWEDELRRLFNDDDED